LIENKIKASHLQSIRKRFKMNKVFLVILLSITVNLSVSGQQDAKYSHNMFNHLIVNPGYAGLAGDNICATVIQRQQWVGFPGRPKTTNLSVHMPISPWDINSGVGLTMVSDQIGFEKNFDLRGAYSYHLPVKDGLLGLGAEFGFHNSSFEGAANLKTPESGTIDNILPNQDFSSLAFDMAIGAFYKSERLYLGLSANHLNSPKMKFESKSGNESFTKVTRHYFLTAGYTIPLSIPLLEVTPSIYVKMEEKSLSSQIDINTLAVYNKKFWGGVSYSTGDAFVAMVGLQLYEGLKIGVAYDITHTKIRKVSDYTVEFMLNYCFNLETEKTPRRYKSVRFL
jgi:type IX secretion system PorP/SprF family membrane protein